MIAAQPLITLLTDFGDQDGYVGAVKGAILALSPNAQLVDLAHGVQQGDILGGAFIWRTATETFPPGAIHLGVVDPGVGTARRAVAVQTHRGIFVAPDNGLLTGVLTEAAISAVDLGYQSAGVADVSPTFHGRDVFAPAVGHLAAGGSLADLGPPVNPATLTILEDYAPRIGADGAEGRVLVVDRFGNLRTNLPGHLIGGDTATGGGAGTILVTTLGGEETAVERVATTYGDVAQGELFAYVGSAGTVEVARRGGSAAAALGVRAGAVVSVRPDEIQR